MKKMKKTILFLPFLQIPSGHHHAANAVIDGIKAIFPEIKCEKVDILHYSYGKIERLVSTIYLKWIHACPNLYNYIYQHAVYRKVEDTKRYRLYEWLFLYFINKLVNEKQPDLIICTHALPSYMLNHLKKKHKINIPVINIYTDYFIHRFWGVDHIDFHFVSSNRMKKFLIAKGIREDNIFITGIPIHSKIKKQMELQQQLSNRPVFSVLICGGNMGVGAIDELMEKMETRQSLNIIRFYVLCGKNNKLYKSLKEKQNSYLIPLPYLDCREKMNRLYDKMDAILTKPGGVTVSEGLFKRKPIFIYHALPGQEQINLKELKDLGIVFQLQSDHMYEQIISILQNKHELQQYGKHVASFHSLIHPKEPSQIVADILIKTAAAN